MQSFLSLSSLCCHSQRSGHGCGTEGATGRCLTPVQQQRTRSSRQRRRCRRRCHCRSRPLSLETNALGRAEKKQRKCWKPEDALQIIKIVQQFPRRARDRDARRGLRCFRSLGPHVQRAADGWRLTTLLSENKSHVTRSVNYGRPVVQVFRVRLGGEGCIACSCLLKRKRAYVSTTTLKRLETTPK